ncbi:DUF6644 family protein [Massilia sp. YIM B02443]|uniref:DUF6644 family protein n=1 Tax=Massilia sp. YIM B02443 TaxID=3050127 RepID=UPI0025B6E0A3|nr:DUF6644 family protein [Massilia sp. YIM B02443]MDN4037107.1 hypothetical protein [Massilia sp. YIM B02443]
MRDDPWLYPMVEIAHIVGFSVLVGAVAMFDLRLLGLGRALPVQALARHLLPWSWIALLLIVPSGLLMFSTQPELLDNRVFLFKLALIATAGLNALVFHAGPWRRAAHWGDAPPVAARLHAGASLLLWIGVIACGRLLAYV